jgi:hypothetical protein
MAVPRMLSIFKVRSEGNLEFWVSNLIIVVSTVLGVFLAAQAGFKTALEFEVVRNEREGFYMRRAMLDELKDNLDQADKYVDYVVNKDGWRFKADANAYKLHGYVWETMKQQSITFQLPRNVLTGVRRYYDDAEANASGMREGQGTAMEAAKALQEATKKMRETVVPEMEKGLAAVQKRLESRGLVE